MGTSYGFDTTELDKLAADMYKTANERYPKEVRQFLKDQGNAGAKILRAETKSKIKGHRTRTTKEEKKTALMRGIKRTKVTKYKGDFQVRVLTKAYHAHLFEYGHTKVVWGKEPKGEKWVEGRFPAQAAHKQLEAKFPGEVGKFVEGLMKEGLELR